VVGLPKAVNSTFLKKMEDTRRIAAKLYEKFRQMQWTDEMILRAICTDSISEQKTAGHLAPRSKELLLEE
jgi:hypothetical protein